MNHQMMPMLMQKAVENKGPNIRSSIANGEEDMMLWLVDNMKHIINSTGLHRGLTCMFNMGRFSHTSANTSAFSRIWSSICVAEFLTRFATNKLEGGPAPVREYPMSFLLAATSAFDHNFHLRNWPRKWWSELKYQYGKMKNNLYMMTGMKVATYSYFKRSIFTAKKIIQRLMDLCRSVGKKIKIAITPDFVFKQMRYVELLLRKVTRRTLERHKGLEELITEDTLFGTQSISFLKNKLDTDGSDDDLDSLTIGSLDDSVCSENHWWNHNVKISDFSTTTSCTSDISVDTEGSGATDSMQRNSKSTNLLAKQQNSSNPSNTRDNKRGLHWKKRLISKRQKISLSSTSNTDTSTNNGISVTPPPRRQLPRSILLKQLNPIHFKEDTNITEPSTVAVNLKPGYKLAPQPSIQDQLTDRETSHYGCLFDNGVEEFVPLRSVLPQIFVETFRNDKFDIVPGPFKYKTKEGKQVAYDIGSQYLQLKGDHQLKEVLCCGTSKAYVYFFKHANFKPHFVAGNQVATQYREKIQNMDIDLKVIPQWKLEHPVKVINDMTIRDGLRQGMEEESDFIFISDRTSLFKDSFGHLGNLQFPTAHWMLFLDKKTQSKDVHGRNFKFGHHDCGYGREGVALSAHATQDRGIEFVLGKPHIIGDSGMMKTLGPLVDKTTLLMDTICFENGQRLMNDTYRDSIFGSDLRCQINSHHSRFEAFTVVRQPLGSRQDVTEGKVKFPGTDRHLDGPNCGRTGYRMVAVTSFLCVWRETVYRMSIIMYTRQSCGNYCWRNYFARVLRQKLRDYIVESNGGIHYSNFSLSDSMNQFKGEYNSSAEGNTDVFWLRPVEEDLSGSYLERNPNSRWVQQGPTRVQYSPTWKSFDWGGKFEKPLRIILLPEFLCRFGFVSSFASQINRFESEGQIETPSEQIHQLLYAALLSSSQIQFFYVMELLIARKRDLLQSYKSAKAVTGDKTDITLFREYQNICKTRFSTMTGGPFYRVQAQPTNHAIFFDDNDLRENLEKIPKVIQKLEDGQYLNSNGLLVKRPGIELAMVGDVASLSCAPLVVFVGKAKSEQAINTAKQAMINTKSKNSYYSCLKEYLDGYNKAEPKMKIDEHFILRIFRGIAKSWNTVIGSIENGCCATFRTAKKFDVFFYGQEMYILDDTCSNVMVKEYGVDTWEVKEFSN